MNYVQVFCQDHGNARDERVREKKREREREREKERENRIYVCV